MSEINVWHAEHVIRSAQTVKDRNLAYDHGMSYENICFVTEDNIALVTLNRPQRRNALSLALMGELIDCLGAIGSRRDLRVVILAATGNVFCSGHDLSEMVGRKEANTCEPSKSAPS